MPPDEEEEGDMDGERKVDFSDMVMTGVRRGAIRCQEAVPEMVCAKEERALRCFALRRAFLKVRGGWSVASRLSMRCAMDERAPKS